MYRRHLALNLRAFYAFVYTQDALVYGLGWGRFCLMIYSRGSYGNTVKRHTVRFHRDYGCDDGG